jgi:hypothetical protein
VGSDSLPCRVHEAATIFPMMSADEFEGLKKDIAENGVQDKIVFWDGRLLDGRNRLAAMIALGIDWEQHRHDLRITEDPVAYVISHNLHRRHLNASQLGMVAAKLRPIFEKQAEARRIETQGRPRKGAEKPPANLPAVSKDARDAAGEALNVSGKTVDAATAVLETGNKELIAMVEQGEIAVSAVAKQLKEDQATAAEIVTRIKSGGEQRPKASGRDQWDRLGEMLSRARNYFEQLVAERRDNAKSEAVLNLFEDLDGAVDSYRKSVSRGT